MFINPLAIERAYDPSGLSVYISLPPKEILPRGLAEWLRRYGSVRFGDSQKLCDEAVQYAMLLLILPGIQSRTITCIQFITISKHSQKE